MSTAICTWFVADEADEATFLPQIGGCSDVLETKAIYLRCAVVFFASSLACNPAMRHVFFTNRELQQVDGIDIEQLLDRWGVELIRLPITYRLPRGTVNMWGNQFYAFDVIAYLAANALADETLLLDSDCLWLRPVDELAALIREVGCVCYPLGEDEHGSNERINGCSRAELALFLRDHGGEQRTQTPYYGGEFYAARQDVTIRLAQLTNAIWPSVLRPGPGVPREEAHLLSILFALEGLENAYGARFIRRLWTTFRRNNLKPSDRELMIWHLPAEKLTGFADLFRKVTARPMLHPSRDAAAMSLTFDDYARAMGWPRRSTAKFLRDLALKVTQKARPLLIEPLRRRRDEGSGERQTPE